MTSEEKQLLLQDLCSRLPYGVFVEENRTKLDPGPVIYTYDYHPCIDNCKPYLRPMSSMTEEESNILCAIGQIKSFENIANWKYWTSANEEFIDYLNKHHFDYRGLIPMGLALEAPEDMYNIE